MCAQRLAVWVTSWLNHSFHEYIKMKEKGSKIVSYSSSDKVPFCHQQHVDDKSNHKIVTFVIIQDQWWVLTFFIFINYSLLFYLKLTYRFWSKNIWKLYNDFSSKLHFFHLEVHLMMITWKPTRLRTLQEFYGFIYHHYLIHLLLYFDLSKEMGCWYKWI